jgi:hypothetical protein
MPCQWYVRGGGEGKQRIVIGQSVPPTPFGMAFGRLKLSPLFFAEMRYNVLYRAKRSSYTQEIVFIEIYQYGYQTIRLRA